MQKFVSKYMRCGCSLIFCTLNLTYSSKILTSTHRRGRFLCRRSHLYHSHSTGRDSRIRSRRHNAYSVTDVTRLKAFGNQIRLAKVYGGHVDQAFIVDLKAAIVHGAGLAFFFFIIYASYALAFYFGTTLLLQGYGELLRIIHRSDLTDYCRPGNVGTIINVFMAILTGSFSLALLAPEVQGTNSPMKIYTAALPSFSHQPCPSCCSEDFRDYRSSVSPFVPKVYFEIF